MKKKLLEKKYYFYALLLSFIILLITSKCSFLYPFNDWVDANAFFTVGKSMFKGVIPYKDIFEQKGILLYFIYGIGSLISYKNFYGVFILEVFSLSIFLYYAHKIFSVFLDKKYSIILLPILGCLITTSYTFVHGGSCEEFSLPFFAISLYYYFKHFKIEKLTNKEIIINGIIAGCIMMLKYTMLGFYIGFCLFIFIDYIKNKDIKKAFMYCIYYVLGMLIPIALFFIYLVINGALKDYIDCYFLFNMTSYNKSSSIFNSLLSIPKMFYRTLGNNGIIRKLLIILLPLYVLSIKTEKNKIYFKISLIIIFIFTFTSIYWGLRLYKYYLLPVFVFLIVALLGITLFISKYTDKYINKKIMYPAYILVIITCILLSYHGANYKEMLLTSKKDFFQFKYADYINKYSNPTLLNTGFLDGGLYTTTGIVPNTRFFEYQNISYELFPENQDEMVKYIKNKEVKFILYYTNIKLEEIEENESYIFDNYELIFDDVHNFEHGNMVTALLFKLKGLEENN